MINITNEAVEAVKDAMVRAGQTDGGLRITAADGGCAGYKYVVTLDVSERTDDTVFESSGVRLFVDPDSKLKLDGMTLGFSAGLEGSGFTFENPNATSTCGCKKSFS